VKSERIVLDGVRKNNVSDMTTLEYILQLAKLEIQDVDKIFSFKTWSDIFKLLFSMTT
jgi:hypothetical protein